MQLPELENWKIARADGVLRLSLNQPEAGNALSPDMLAELRQLVHFATEDPTSQVIVLSGEGRHFSQGMDMSVLATIASQDAADFATNLQELQLAFDELELLPKPVIACLHGFCIGGGLIMAACCDFRIASRKTIFALPEVRAGLGVIMGLQRVVDLVGVGRARELVLLGERFNAQKALSIGLVQSLVEPDALVVEADRLAKKLLELPAHGLSINKAIATRTKGMSIRAAQDLEIELQAAYLQAPAFQQLLAKYTSER